MVHVTGKAILVALGWLSLAVGIVGIFLPILPTTPFVILAAFLFSKGSIRLHRWLVTRPYVGPAVVEWESHGVIRMRAKLWATAAVALLFVNTIIFVPVAAWIKVIVAVTGAAVLAFIWTRPSLPPEERQAAEAAAWPSVP